MTNTIALGIDIAYDRIVGSILEPARQYICEVGSKKYFIPSVSYENNVRLFGEKMDDHFTGTFLKRLVNESKVMEKQTVTIFNDEYAIIDELTMQWFMMKFAKEASTRGQIVETIISVPNKADIFARKRIAKSAEMANLPNVQVIPSAILPFAFMQNFDLKSDSLRGQRQSYIFIDVNTEEISFVYGVCGREESRREIIVEKVKVIDFKFANVIDIIKNYIMTKHEKAIEEENDQDSEKPLDESSVISELPNIIENFCRSDVFNFDKTFEDKDGTEADVEIVRSEIEKELEEIIEQIIASLKEFLEEIKNESDATCLVDFTGYYSRFKIIEEPMKKVLMEYNHTVRDTNNREELRSNGCSLLGGMKMKDDYDISLFEDPEKSYSILDRKANRFFFNVYMNDTQVKFVKVTEGSEGDRETIPECYFDMLNDRYEVSFDVNELNDGENTIEVELEDEVILSCTYNINKNEILSQQNELKGSTKQPQHFISVQAYLNVPGDEGRKIVVKHSVVYADNIVFHQPVSYKSTIIPHQLLDGEFVNVWKEQTEVMNKMYEDEKTYESFKRIFAEKKTEFLRLAKENETFKKLKDLVIKLIREKKYNQEGLDQILSLEKSLGYKN